MLTKQWTEVDVIAHVQENPYRIYNAEHLLEKMVSKNTYITRVKYILL